MVLLGVAASIEVRLRGHEHARRADAALCAARLEEGLLERAQRARGSAALGQAFDRPELRAIGLADRHEAAVDHLAVEDDRAGAALALAAAFLGAGEAEVLAQHVEEAAHAGHGDLARLAVDGEAEGRADAASARLREGGHAWAASAARMRSGVAGSSVTQTPTASWMASMTAGATTSMGSSPTPLAPCGRAAEGLLDEDGRDARRIERGGDEVGGQPVVEIATVLHLHLLDGGIADRLERPAFDLTLGQDGMDDTADIIGRDDAAHVDLAGIQIDVHLGDRAGPAEDRVGVAGVGRLVELDIGIGLEALVDAGRAVRSRIELIRLGEGAAAARLDRGPQALGGLDDEPAHDHGRARGHGGAAVGDDRGVHRGHLDLVRLDAQGLGGEHRKDGLGALADLGVGDEDANDAVVAELDAGHAREHDLAASGEAGAVPGHRESDARDAPDAHRVDAAARVRGLPPAHRPGLLAELADALVLGSLGGALQHLRGAHALTQALPGGRRVALAIHPAGSQLRGREAQRIGGAGHLELRGELDLRRPEAPEGTVGRRVRGHGAAADARVRAVVRPAGMEDAARQHHRRKRAVGASVHDDLDVLGDEVAVCIHAGAIADDRGVALRRGRDVLVPVVDHAHGLARHAAPGARHGWPRLTGTPPFRRSLRQSPPA